MPGLRNFHFLGRSGGCLKMRWPDAYASRGLYQARPEVRFLVPFGRRTRLHILRPSAIFQVSTHRVSTVTLGGAPVLTGPKTLNLFHAAKSRFSAALTNAPCSCFVFAEIAAARPFNGGGMNRIPTSLRPRIPPLRTFRRHVLIISKGQVKIPNATSLFQGRRGLFRGSRGAGHVSNTLPLNCIHR